jgi:hypothetical protein
MKTKMKVFRAAMGIAVLSSPVAAQTWRDANIPVSTENVFWGLALAPLYAPPLYGPAYGSVARAPAGRFVPGPGPAAVPVPLPRILDCVHVTFPQCGGGAGGG